MRIKSLAFSASLITWLFLSITVAQATEPVIISNETQLLEINNDREGSYRLGASFALSPTAPDNATYISDIFTGIFNGNGFVLSGLTGSLFSAIDGTVSNLNLVTTTAAGGITSYGASGCQAGVLAGSLGNNGVIDGVHVSGAITTGGYCEATGGLVGVSGSTSRILNSSSSVNITSTDDNVGGLVGGSRGSISNSSSSGIIQGFSVTGGIVGGARSGSIDTSFSTASVSGGSNVGSFAGSTSGNFTISRSSTSGTFESLIGYIRPDDGDGTIFEVVVSDVSGSDTRTITNPDEWGQSQYINSGVPYIKALKVIGFYTDTTPTAPSAAALEAQAKAAAAVAAVKREAEVKTARADLSKTLEKADKLTADSFAKAEIAGVTKENIAEVQAEILALPVELRTDINQVLKVARKFEVVGKIASEQATTLPISAFVEVGLIPTDSKNKVALIAAIRRASADSRDSFADIKAVIAAEAARIQDRKDRLAAAISRNKSK